MVRVKVLLLVDIKCPSAMVLVRLGLHNVLIISGFSNVELLDNQNVIIISDFSNAQLLDNQMLIHVVPE